MRLKKGMYLLYSKAPVTRTIFIERWKKGK